MSRIDLDRRIACVGRLTSPWLSDVWRGDKTLAPVTSFKLRFESGEDTSEWFQTKAPAPQGSSSGVSRCPYVLLNDPRPLGLDRVPNRTPIHPATSLALEFESMTSHSPSTFGANTIQDVGNNFCYRLERNHSGKRHGSTPLLLRESECHSGLCNFCSIRRATEADEDTGAWLK